jgi:hypothetical protein
MNQPLGALAGLAVRSAVKLFETHLKAGNATPSAGAGEHLRIRNGS